MPSLKEVRLRIQSINSTQQITKAMKMVAAAKLRRAQDAIIQMRPYTQRLQTILQNISAQLEDNTANPFAEEREPPMY
jgi:F-type H+-transporting ATPase subunit gamma